MVDGGAAGDRRPRREPAAGRRGGAGGGQGAARVDRGQPLHVPRLPRVRPDRRERRRARCAAFPAPVSASCATRAAATGVVKLPREARAIAHAEGPARPHEGELARDGAPARLSRLRRRQALRRGRGGRRRAALPRPLHVDGLQRAAGRDPAAPAQGAARPRALGPPAGKPRRQGAGGDPRELPARRALPDLGRRPLRDRHGHPPPRRAPARAALPAPRHVPALPLLPRLRPARPLQHAGARADRGDPRRRRSTGRASTTTSASRSRCSRASTTSSTPRRGRRCRTSTSREIEARIVEATRSWADDLHDALVDQLGEERGTELFGLYRDAFPPAYRDDFSPRDGRARHPAHGAARPRGRPRLDALPAARGRRRLLRPEAPALGQADSPLGRPAAPRGPGREGLRRAPVRESTRAGSVDVLDLRLRPHERGRRRSTSTSWGRPSRTPSRRPGAARSRSTASTGSSCARG